MFSLTATGSWNSWYSRLSWNKRSTYRVQQRHRYICTIFCRNFDCVWRRSLALEWLSWLSMLPLIWSCVVRLPQIFWESIVVGFDSDTLHHPAQSCLVCKEKGLAPLQAVCRLPPRGFQFPLMLQLRQSPFAKDGWRLTYANKTREAHRVVGRLCYEISHVTPWS